MNRNTWRGDFRGEERGARNWSFTSAGEHRVGIELLGADIEPHVASLALTGISVEWLPDAAIVELNAPGGVLSIRAAEVLVHEPLADLYRALPLAQFDARAQRFWRRVFWLARLPGGRRILRMLARRARA